MSDWMLMVLSDFSIPNFIAIAALVWFMRKEQNARFDKLDMKVDDINMRLCRLEGAFMSKECCLLSTTCHPKAERQAP